MLSRTGGAIVPRHAPIRTNRGAAPHRKHTVSPMIAGQIAEYHQSRERNTGSVFRVRRTPATHAWLTDALDIRANQQAMLRARNFGYNPKLPGSGSKDQSAFRESFFLHRHRLQEFLAPLDLACRSQKPTGNRCSCTCECSSCLLRGACYWATPWTPRYCNRSLLIL